jgi:hypothetical protein
MNRYVTAHMTLITFIDYYSNSRDAYYVIH